MDDKIKRIDGKIKVKMQSVKSLIKSGHTDRAYELFKDVEKLKDEKATMRRFKKLLD